MILKPFVHACERALKERQASLQDQLVSGKASDFTEYRRLCAKHTAFDEAVTVLWDCYEKRNEEHDDEDDS